MDDELPAEEESRGVPAWVMTFADLMTLLMCFFVLLLAFSEMDVAKFKQLSGSMKNAFGVQAEIEARTIPKGTSVIAREFSPGKPQPTMINDVRQFTIDSNKNTLDFDEPDDVNGENYRIEEEAERIRKALEPEIAEGAVAVATQGSKVIIHVLEKTSFRSGYADVQEEFKPTLVKIARILRRNTGRITVAGHTDDRPISNARFRSNWELSTSRAVSVAEVLMASADVAPARFMVAGHAATKPRAPNDSAENRAANRRVDIRIDYGPDEESLNVLSAEQYPEDQAPETEAPAAAGITDESDSAAAEQETTL
jgi:chemotaxis protein MotB